MHQINLSVFIVRKLQFTSYP